MPIVRVALDIPLNTLFDYLALDIEVTEQDIGVRALVPFGKNMMTGMIMEVTTHSSVSFSKLKHVAHIFRDVPPLPRALLDLFRFCSEYYHHPLGEVVMNGLPNRLRSSKPFTPKGPSACQYGLTSTGRKADTSVIPARHIVKHRLLARLRESGVMSISEAKRLSPRAPKALNELITLRWVEEISFALPSTPVSTAQGLQIPVLTTDQRNAVDV